MGVQEILDSKLLSQTAINKFYECPKKYELIYADQCQGNPEPNERTRFDYGWFGSMMHTILEDFYRPQYFPDDDDLDRDAKNKIEAVLLQLLDAHWEYGQSEVHLMDAKDMLRLFSIRESGRWKVWRMDPDPGVDFIPRFRELDIKDEKIRLRAIIDAMWTDKDGNIILVRDYKSNKKAELTGPMKMQALVTAMLIDGVFGQMIKEFEFLFLRVNKPIRFEITTERINKAIGKIEYMWEQIEKQEFQKNTKECYWCPMKLYCEGKSRCWIC